MILLPFSCFSVVFKSYTLRLSTKQDPILGKKTLQHAGCKKSLTQVKYRAGQNNYMINFQNAELRNVTGIILFGGDLCVWCVRVCVEWCMSCGMCPVLRGVPMCVMCVMLCVLSVLRVCCVVCHAVSQCGVMCSRLLRPCVVGECVCVFCALSCVLLCAELQLHHSTWSVQSE